MSFQFAPSHFPNMGKVLTVRTFVLFFHVILANFIAISCKGAQKKWGSLAQWNRRSHTYPLNIPHSQGYLEHFSHAQNVHLDSVDRACSLMIIWTSSDCLRSLKLPPAYMIKCLHAQCSLRTPSQPFTDKCCLGPSKHFNPWFRMLFTGPLQLFKGNTSRVHKVL